jgi:competence protein ComEA
MLDSSPSPRVDLNRATPVLLATSLGLRPTLAAKIVAYRSAHGPFRAVDDLASVGGVGPRTLERLRERAIVVLDASEAETLRVGPPEPIRPPPLPRLDAPPVPREEAPTWLDARALEPYVSAAPPPAAAPSTSPPAAPARAPAAAPSSAPPRLARLRVGLAVVAIAVGALGAAAFAAVRSLRVDQASHARRADARVAEMRDAITSSETRLEDVELRTADLEAGLERVDHLDAASRRHARDLAALSRHVGAIDHELETVRAHAKVLEQRLTLRELRDETTWLGRRPAAPAAPAASAEPSSPYDP